MRFTAENAAEFGRKGAAVTNALRTAPPPAEAIAENISRQLERVASKIEQAQTPQAALAWARVQSDLLRDWRKITGQGEPAAKTRSHRTLAPRPMPV